MLPTPNPADALQRTAVLPTGKPALAARRGLRVMARGAAMLGLALSALLVVVPAAGQTSRSEVGETSTGPIRLRQPSTPARDEATSSEQRDPRLDRQDARDRDRLDRLDGTDLDRRDTQTLGRGDERLDSRRSRARGAPPGEFETFVQRLAEPLTIRRFGADLVTRAQDTASADFNALVPQDYVVKPGDEVLVTLWGSVDADLRLVVDRSGRIGIPRVGTVQVGGVRYADLSDTVGRRVGQVFRNFNLSVSLGRLRGVRVYVTGFVTRPGAYSVSSLSTITQALLAADGPSAAGSFRNVELRRGGKLEARFDFYDFLLNGDRSGDRVVQADDVIHVGPVGPQVGMIGSVNQPAIFELKVGETVTDVLRMAGGLSTVADSRRLTLERLDDRNDVRITQLELPAGLGSPLKGGDVLRAFSAVDVAIPVQRQNKRVRVEGEVLRPGEYVLPPSSGIADAIAAAGGLTPQAYVFGSEFNRESVRLMQQKNYERALRDLEVEFSRAASGQRVASADEAAAQTARETATTRLIERLRNLRPSGRIVLQVRPDASSLPDLPLEEGDRLFVPPRPTTIGVFGSVYNAGSFLWDPGRDASSYLRLAGGPTRSADPKSVFMIRANGSVVSGQQRSGFFSYGGGLEGVPAEAGDTIFVPDEVNRTTLVQDFKDWTQVIYQLGLGVAAAIAVGR